MESDFGIIPLPKYDEAQVDYISYCANSATALSIPCSVSDVSRSGVVLEVMNALSYETVRPAYFDVVLEGKSTRDSESVKMLELMFGNTEPELAAIFKWGNYQDTLNKVLNKDIQIVSTLAASRNAVETAIENFLAELK